MKHMAGSEASGPNIKWNHLADTEVERTELFDIADTTINIYLKNINEKKKKFFNIGNWWKL